MNNTKSTMLTQFKNFILLRTIYSQIIITFAVFAVVILFFVNLTVTATITRLVEDLIAKRLVADIHYIEDLINHDSQSEWAIKDGSIYFGDVLIGDGTEEKANLAPFLEHEKNTKTLAYVFILDKDAKLGYVPATGSAEGYEEGHYLRVAGGCRRKSRREPSNMNIRRLPKQSPSHRGYALTCLCRTTASTTICCMPTGRFMT